jgi:glucan phosphoethanolaminetransferase (alkaline phosphatase superfamily)
MKLNIIIIILLGILILPMVNAEVQTLGTFKVNTCGQLIQQDANITFSNLTVIQYPDKLTILNINSQMTNFAPAYYNYTFCNMTQLGEYIANGISNKDGVLQSWSYTFYVTPTGIQQSTSQGINSAIFLFLVLGLTFLFGILGFKYSESEFLWVLGIFFLFLSLLFVVWDVWLAYEFYTNLTGINDNNPIPETMFYIFLFVLVAGFLSCGILLFAHWKKVKKWFKDAYYQQKQEDDEDERDWQ